MRKGKLLQSIVDLPGQIFHFSSPNRIVKNVRLKILLDCQQLTCHGLKLRFLRCLNNLPQHLMDRMYLVLLISAMVVLILRCHFLLCYVLLNWLLSRLSIAIFCCVVNETCCFLCHDYKYSVFPYRKKTDFSKNICLLLRSVRSNGHILYTMLEVLLTEVRWMDFSTKIFFHVYI